MKIKESTMERSVREAVHTPCRLGIVRASALCAIASLGLLLAMVQPAQAGFDIARFDGAVTANQAGDAYTQAGGHPFEVTTTIDFNTTTDPLDGSTVVPDEEVRNIRVSLPAGFVGNPNALPQCSESDLEKNTGAACPANTQIGYVVLDTATALGKFTIGVYNQEPSPGVPATFAFQAPLGLATVHLQASVRSDSDYGVDIEIPNISQTTPVKSTTLVLWGVPADAAHDPYRGVGFFCLGGAPADPGALCLKGGVKATVPLKPFLTNPTDCSTGPVTTTLRADSWQHPADFKTASFVSHDGSGSPIGVTGCDRVPFEPSLTLQPNSAAANTPSGYTVQLHMPQNDNPTGLAQAALKKVTVRLPEGVSVSPSSANGLGACSPEQIGIGAATAPNCPDSAKIGTVTIDTPLLAEPMTGAVYLAQPTSSQLLKIYLVAEGSGVIVKLQGAIDPDAKTGEITATFDNNPQLPFSEMNVRFNGGPRAPLLNPSTCGPATTTTTFTAWSGAVVTGTDTFNVSKDGNGASCPPIGFAPGFTAGSVNPAGGADSTFTLTFSRSDQDQTLGNVAVTMPEGVTGRIADVPLCSDAQANGGTCGEASRVGSTTTAAGAGSNPYYLPGRVYMTGPYKGAPFGMSIVVPAVAGPFDLGVVVVRAAVFVDPTTAALRVVSDPLPTILQGIPLQIRSVNVTIDKSQFMLNPTDCTPSSVNGRIGSTAGAMADVSSRYQVANCASLPFRPKMTLKVGSRRHTQRDRSTPLAVTLSMTRGQANNSSVQVTLPDTINARLPVVNRACTPQEFAAGNCESARVGSAVAVTPLLRDPLRGSVYFVRSTDPRQRLPDLVVPLRGQVDVDLVGKIAIVNNRLLRTTFGSVPDVPITKFRLNLVAGTQGPVGVVTNLCSRRGRRRSIARLAMRAQSGRLVQRNQRMKIAGCARARRAPRARRSARR